VTSRPHRIPGRAWRPRGDRRAAARPSL